MASNQSLLYAGYVIYTIKQKKNLILIIPFNFTYYTHFTEMETESLFLRPGEKVIQFWVWISPVYTIMVHDQWHPLWNVKLYPINSEKTNSEGESI